jgi:serine/threonine-protein kinase RsbW
VSASASAARDFVREACAGHLGAEQLDTAVLLTSELVANAIRHTRSDSFEVHISLSRDGIQIAVRDRDKTAPVLGAPEPDSASGRGLQLVDQLSGGWGVKYGEAGGKSVWFNLRANRGL